MTLDQWTIYHNPKDFPGKYVARRFEIGPGTVTATTEHYAADSLSAVRRMIPNLFVRYIPIARSPEDDPVIVEVWI